MSAPFYCKRGHLRTPENTGARGRCLKCKRITDVANRKRPNTPKLEDPPAYPAFTGREPCREDPYLFYSPEGRESPGSIRARQSMAVEMCAACPLIDACREWGLRRELHGIWGGMTERDRDAYRRTHGIRLVTPESEWNFDAVIGRQRREATSHVA